MEERQQERERERDKMRIIDMNPTTGGVGMLYE